MQILRDGGQAQAFNIPIEKLPQHLGTVIMFLYHFNSFCMERHNLAKEKKMPYIVLT